MYGSTKKTPAPEFSEWLLENKHLSVAWCSLPGTAKRAELHALAEEQDGLCVYCGRRLEYNSDEHGQPRNHIEHFRPRTDYPDQAFSHSNLFVSCGPASEGDGSSIGMATCGVHKADDFDEDLFVYPSREDCQGRFSFSVSGDILTGTEDYAARKMVDILNLNAKHLVKARESQFLLLTLEIQRQLNNGYSSETLIRMLLGRQDGQTADFAHMLEQLIAGPLRAVDEV